MERKLDLTASLENAYALSPYANYYIASEELEPGHGWNYTEIFSALVEDPTLTGKELGQVIADGFLEQAQKYEQDAAVTLSVTDLRKIDGVMDLFDELFAEISPSIEAPTQLNLISKGRSRSESYGGNSSHQGFSDLIKFLFFRVQTPTSKRSVGGNFESGGVETLPDYPKFQLAETSSLGHFLENIKDEYELADELLDALDEAVVYTINGPTRKNSNGLSIYFPYKDKENFEEHLAYYFQLDFSENYQTFVENYVSKLDSIYTGIELLDTGTGSIGEEEETFSIIINPEDIDDIESIFCFLAIYLDEEETESRY